VGDRGENLRRAIGCFEAALRVRTEDRFPAGWALTNLNHGAALVDLAAVTADRSYLQAALTAFENARRGFRAVGMSSDAEKAHERAERVRKHLAERTPGGQ
jgi:hypothetical protein